MNWHVQSDVVHLPCLNGLHGQHKGHELNQIMEGSQEQITRFDAICSTGKHFQ